MKWIAHTLTCIGPPNFPNYHYVRLELHGNRVRGEMIRLGDYNEPEPKQWQTRDRFNITLRP